MTANFGRTEEEEMRKLEGRLQGAVANAREYKVIRKKCSSRANAKEYEVSESRMSALKDIMEALTDPNVYMMGVCGKDDTPMAALLKGVKRKGRRDNLFDVIVMVSIGKDQNLRRIQEEIARGLSFILQGQGQGKSTLRVFTNSNKKAVTENARQLSDLIRSKPRILFILRCGCYPMTANFGRTEEEEMRKLEGRLQGAVANAREYRVEWCSRPLNARQYEVLKSRMSALKDIMEALTDPNVYMMGVCGKDDTPMAALLEKVKRNGVKDNLFDENEIVMVSIGKDQNLRRIQEEIARGLSFILQGQGQGKSILCVFTNSNKKAVTENARQLSDLIRSKPRILFILRDLHSRLDLTKLGIPFGEDHKGCKLILTSQSEEILNHMHEYSAYFPVWKPSFINNSF